MSRIRLVLVSCLIAAPAFATPDVAVSLPNKLAPIGEAMHGAIVLTNGGTSTASNISVNYQPPVETTLVNVVAPSGTTCHGTIGSNAMVTCSVSSLAAGAQMTIDVLTQVPSNLSSGTQLQLFAQAVTPSDFNSANDNATSTMTAVVRPRIRMTSNLPSSYVPGTTLTYSLTVTNDGPGTANNFAIADALNRYDLLTVSAKTRGSGTLNCQGSTAISCSGNNLASGASAIIDVTVTPSPKLGGQTNGSLTETASVTQTDFGLLAATFSGTATVNDVADLGITGTAQSVNAVGDDLAYTVTITNAGPSSTRRAVVSWNTPAGTTFLSVTPANGCATPLAGAAGIVTCNVAALDPGATATYVFHAEVPGSGSVTNSATVTLSTDPNTANNTTSTTTTVTVTPLADLSLVVSGDAYAIAGRPFNINLIVQNAGPSTAQAVTVTLTGFTSAGGPNCTGDSTIVCSIGDVLSGGLAGLNVSATTTSALANVTVAATVATRTTDPNGSNNSGSITLPLYPASADLGVAVAPLANANNIAPRGSVAFNVTVTNRGPAPADGTLHVNLPDGASFDGLGDCPNGICSIVAAPPGSSRQLVIPIKAPAANGTYAAHFRIDGLLSDSNASDNDAFVPFSVSDRSGASTDLAVTMTAPTTIAPNAIGIWSATIANGGTADAALPKLTLHLPADVIIASVPSACVSGTPIVCSLATLSAGVSQTFVVAAKTGSSDIAAEAIATSATTDGNVANNLVVTQTSVAASSLGIAMQPAQAVASTKPVSFTITLTNRGTAALTNVALHAFVTMAISLTSTKANCSAVDCSLPSLAVNDTVAINGVATGAGTAAFITTADGVPSNGALLRVTASDQHHRAARR